MWTENVTDVQPGFTKGRGTRDQMSASTGSQKKKGNYRKTSISALLTMLKPFVDHNKLIEKEREL